MMLRGGAFMRTVADCVKRAEECRLLATQCSKSEHWGHFLEMAETWEMLLKHQQERSRLQTIALANRFRDVLSLSEVAPKGQPEAGDNEKAA
jgi:hypothetical protein